MIDTLTSRRLLWHMGLGLFVCAALVALSYYFVDRPVAWFVYDLDLARFGVLKWLTYPPPIVQTGVPVLLAGLLMRVPWGPWLRWEQALLAAGISVVLADQFCATIAYAAGRYWPETWIDNNPSLIGDGAYGFHPFHDGSAYGSFPSGHMTRTLAAAAVFWIAYPTWRWLGVLASLAVAIGLIGMNYHFVGDVIAGAFVGGVVVAYLAHGSGLNKKSGQHQQK